MTVQSRYGVVSIEASRPQVGDDLGLLLRRYLTEIGEPFATARVTPDSRFVEMRFSSGMHLTAPRPVSTDAFSKLAEQLNPGGCHMICLDWAVSGCKRIWIGDAKQIVPSDINVLVIPDNQMKDLAARPTPESNLFDRILRHAELPGVKSGGWSLLGVLRRLMRLE